MTPDSDADPDRPKAAPVPPSLPPNDYRAIEAAVAGVAGLLLGRVLLGRAGGLVAGIAAVGAGLLTKRVPLTKKEEALDGTAPTAVDGAPVSAPPPDAAGEILPVTRVRLETGAVPAVDHRAALVVAKLPDTVEAAAPAPVPGVEIPTPEEPLPGNPPEAAAFPNVIDEQSAVIAGDAGAFAEMPALFMPPPSFVPKVAFGAEQDISLPEWPALLPVEERPARAEPNEVPAVTQAEPPARPPEADAAEEQGNVTFDDHPLRPSVEILPVSELIERVEKDLAAERPPDRDTGPPLLKPASVPPAEPLMPGLLGDLPSEYATSLEEPEAGPREEFLIVPDFPSVYPPPIQPVVAALSASLELRDKSATHPERDPEMSRGEAMSVAADSSPGGVAANESMVAPDAAATPGGSAGPVPTGPPPDLIHSWELPRDVPPEPIQGPPEPPQAIVAADELEEKHDAGVPTAETSAPVPDPEEIWRQAAVELAALRSAPVPASPPQPSPSAEMQPSIPAGSGMTLPPPPPFPSVAAPFTVVSPPPAIRPIPVVAEKSPQPPPWLKDVVSPHAPEGGLESEAKPVRTFPPTIRLAVPQGPQPATARRPVPLPMGHETATLESVPVAPATPIPLPGDRAKPILPIQPASGVAPALASSSPVLPVPVTPVAISRPLLATHGPSNPSPPPVSSGAGPRQDSATNDARIFIPRPTSSHVSLPSLEKKRLLTPLRVALLAVLAAAGLGMVFKSTLIDVWEHQILGKPIRANRGAPSTRPGSVVPRPQGDAADVTIAPEPAPSPAVPGDPPATQATPDKDSAPTSPAVRETTPSDSSAPPENQAVPVSPPRAAEPEPPGPLPVSESGARELSSRLLRATSVDVVKAYISDAAKLATGLESCFASGKAIPVVETAGWRSPGSSAKAGVSSPEPAAAELSL